MKPKVRVYRKLPLIIPARLPPPPAVCVVAMPRPTAPLLKARDRVAEVAGLQLNLLVVPLDREALYCKKCFGIWVRFKNPNGKKAH